MIIENLKARNFRNYENFSLQLKNGIHFIVGNNGQGKTNILEAIYFLSCTKSHRTNVNGNLIKKGSPFFILESDVIRNDKKLNIRCIVNEEGKNLYFYNNPIKKVSDFIGSLNAVMFCPNDMNLFDTVPKERRKFVDLELGKLSKTYTATLNTYYHLLKERNAYLKKEKVDEIFLDILDDQLIEVQLTILSQRKKFIDDIIKNSYIFYEKLSHDSTKIKCKYVSFVEYDEKEKMKEKMREKYKKSRERDIFYKQTHIGIHKDDFIFMMNGNEVSSFASQGQKRSIILSLKLGIVETIYLVSKTYPILLLDDVFSELDEKRREMLLHLLSDEMQIFITSTDQIHLKENKKIYYWYVNEGNIKKMEG